MAFVYSPHYFADIGPHVFPIEKYRLLYDKLRKEARFPKQAFIEPATALEEDLRRVHTAEYLSDLKHCRVTPRTQFSELPVSAEVIALFVLAAGGTIAACCQAVQNGWSVHLSGGFHHAFAAKAEGFCYLNDLAVGTRYVQAAGLAGTVAILDCDLHQGNGTAAIFSGDDSVFTFSIHQRNLYPLKEKSDLDIHLDNGVADEVYLGHLRTVIPDILAAFAPDLVLYQAGADPYQDDQLGNLSLTIAGLASRDELIFTECRERQIPVAVTLGGGYAHHTEDTVTIHYNTCLAAARILA